MKNKTLKNLFTGLGLASILTISGLSAYYVDHHEQTNVFTLANSLSDKIKLTESEFDSEAAKNIVPLQTVKKNPTITNTSDIDVYGFITVEVPTANVTTVNDDGSVLSADVYELFIYELNPGWIEVTQTTNANSVTHVYAYADTSAMTKLTPSLSATVFDEVTLINLAEGNVTEGTTQNIVVKLYAIQATGLSDVTPAAVWSIMQRSVK